MSGKEIKELGKAATKELVKNKKINIT